MENNKWISTENALPKDWEDVLVAVKGKRTRYVYGVYVSSKGWMASETLVPLDVYAWKELPESSPLKDEFL